MSDAERTQCAMCHEDPAVLRWSHIVPHWAFIRTMGKAPATGGRPLLVSISGGKAKLDQDQGDKKLLCGECERILSKHEGRIEKIVRQESGAFPLLDDALPLSGELSGMGLVDVSKVPGSDSLLFFALSVFWRAHATSTGVTLGADADALRKYLLGAEPVPTCARLLVQLLKPVDDAPAIDRIITWPKTAENDPHRHELLMSGVRFTLITRPTSDPVDRVSLPGTSYALVMNGRRELTDIATMAQASTLSKGLQRRLR